MANLRQIKDLNQKYKKYSPIARAELYSEKFINEGLSGTHIQAAIDRDIRKLSPEYIKYLIDGQEAPAAMLFIDVCDFSTRFSHLKGKEIGKYFDNYYEIVIPIIYKYGGEIDKIMGDGIICLFAPPFQSMSLSYNISQADACAKAIITATEGGDFSSKVAVHDGTINYFINKSGFYNEITVIGKPMTELFRLESVTKGEKITYFENTATYTYFFNQRVQNAYHPKWKHDSNSAFGIKGVDYKNYYTITKQY
jgi:class 3 adenylate cyclase